MNPTPVDAQPATQANTQPLSREPQFSINQWFNEHPIRIIGTPSEPFFYATDLATILGIKNINTSISSFTEEDIVTPEQRERCGIITYKKYRDTMRPNPTVILLTLRGAYRFLAHSRSPSAEELRKKLNYELGFYRTVPEADFVNKIMAIFSTEVFERQKHVLTYYIDLYMPRYNLALEFDEQHHEHHQVYDGLREQAICQHIGCVFIRVAVTDDIFAAAGRIYAHIHARQ
jgi:very-short-patch-repair endonuclease